MLFEVGTPLALESRVRLIVYQSIASKRNVLIFSRANEQGVGKTYRI